MSEDDMRARLKELEADNQRLRRLLDQRNAPAELRHRLRNTLSMFRSIIRGSAVTPRDQEGYAAHLEDRLNAFARAQAAADEFGRVPLWELLSEELLSYGVSDGERVSLNGPEVAFQPRPGLVFALTIHELAVNAVEHGSLGLGTGRIEVNWRVRSLSSGPCLDFVWKESGDVQVSGSDHRGFGTEVLTKMLPYELSAKARIDFEPEGLRCSISLPLPPDTGSAEES
ncbi:two-component sensor histidine kinase [Bradyrhizobium sp. USDA 372]